MCRISNKVLRLEMIGAAFIVGLGSSLHFAFGWSSEWKPLALVAAVNESIWEHLKLAFWPGLFWGTLVRIKSGASRLEVLSTKGVTLMATALVIIGVFTTYTAILGRNLLTLDIGTFVLAVVTGQVLSAWLLSLAKRIRQAILWPGLVILVLQVVAYSTFTYAPPDHRLFIDPRSGMTGIH
jgi:hypothetical protein